MYEKEYDDKSKVELAATALEELIDMIKTAPGIKFTEARVRANAALAILKQG